jgi:kynurenine formamidase
MVIIDLSQPIRSETPAFPVYPKPFILRWTSIENYGFKSELIHMVTHTSTHLDAPAHFLKKGKTVDKIALEKFMVDAVALDLSFKKAGGALTRNDFIKAIKGLDIRRGDAVLLYTGWSRKFGDESYLIDYPWLEVDLVDKLLALKVSLVGVDGPSVDSLEGESFPAHQKLLSRGILIIENLCNLKAVVNKRFKLLCFPLKIFNASASPVRAVAILE